LRSDAILLGAISGLAVGAGQAAFLARERVANAWIWVATLGIAWAIGWAVTASIGVALEAGWPVFGLSGALVSQVIAGVVLWKGRVSYAPRVTRREPWGQLVRLDHREA
jgi:hypothetical protein